jgi:hypothetical protein
MALLNQGMDFKIRVDVETLHATSLQDFVGNGQRATTIIYSTFPQRRI